MQGLGLGPHVSSISGRGSLARDPGNTGLAPLPPSGFLGWVAAPAHLGPRGSWARLSREPNQAQSGKKLTEKVRRGEKPLSPLSQDMEVTAEELEHVLNAVLSKSECPPPPCIGVRDGSPALLLRATGCCCAII